MTAQKTCRPRGHLKGPGLCRPCRIASQRRWRARHREELRGRARARWQNNPKVREQARERAYRWRRDHREEYLEKKRQETARRRARQREAGRGSEA